MTMTGSLSSLFPDIARDWDKDKNISLSPSEVSSGSNKNIWWLCKEGHSYQSSVHNRTKKHRGCPYCSNKRVLAGFNDLATTNPELAKEWDLEKNASFHPSEVTANSGKKVWWQCDSGHVWQAAVYSRSNGNGCPYCSGRKPVQGENDLATANPSLAKEWHPTQNGSLTPQDVSCHSSRKAWWQCSKGHEWEAVISSRSVSGCPYCANKKVLGGYNDLATTHPEALAEWCYSRNIDVKPQDVTAGSHRNVWWKCSKGHEWKAPVTRHSKGVGCPICANKKVLSGYNDLATTNPELAAEWHPTMNGSLTPSEVIAGSHKPAWWLCPLGHEWQATIGDRNSGSGCHICANEGQTSFPEQAINYYLSKATPTESRKKIDGDECDIYLSDLNVGIEYDGLYYHDSKKRNTDLQKETRLKQHLKKLIRVREAESGNLTIIDSTITYLPDKNYKNLEDVISALLSLLHIDSQKTDTQFIDIDRDRAMIYQAYIRTIKERSLAQTNPSLAEEWNTEKNGFLSPDHISAGSNKKVWWRCPEGHEYQASISNRSNGKGCPYCAGQRVQSGFNDLATTNPIIADEWDQEKNNTLTPNDVTAHSKKKVWWKCGKGHKWEAAIYSRTNGFGCPYCSNQKVLGGYNDLATINPVATSDWDYRRNGELTPKDVVAKSNKVVWWRCQNGHSWRAPVSRHANGVGCPYCANQKVLMGFNDLASTNPILASEWNLVKNGDLSPHDVVAGSNKKVWWQCKEGHEWEASVAGRSGGKGCPFCANVRILSGFNDLATTNPELAAEWHPVRNGKLLPNHVLAGTKKKVWWQCAEKHEWQASISSRNQGAGCPYCSGALVVSGQNDLATKKPELAKEWLYDKNGELTPDKTAVNSNKKVWWRCFEGHEWQAAINSRSGENGCPYCSGRKAVPGKTDLKTLRPEIAKEWNKEKNGLLSPDMVSPGSSIKVWWLCPKGHEWKTGINNRTRVPGTGCPYCSNKKVLKGFNDLATTNPSLAKSWCYPKNGDLKPTGVVEGSNKKVWWQCSKGHTWQAVVAKRNAGQGCPYCSGKRK